MINMIAKHKENTKYGSILNMGVSITNHVKHKSNKHGKYHTTNETIKHESSKQNIINIHMIIMYMHEH